MTALARSPLDRLADAFVSARPVVVQLRIPPRLGTTARRQLAELTSLATARLRDESLLARALATRMIEACCEVSARRIRHSVTGGKPAVEVRGWRANRAPSISISHSRSTVAVAISAGGRLGVDVEGVRPVSRWLTERAFAPSDTARLWQFETSARARESIRLWAIGEACTKARGHGISLLLEGLGEVGPGAEGRYEELHWAVDITDGEVCALATDHDSCAVEAIQTAPRLTVAQLLSPMTTGVFT